MCHFRHIKGGILESNWAYQNGKRMMEGCKDSQKVVKSGWIPTHRDNNVLVYATDYNGKLEIVVYANKNQALKMVEKQKQLGHNAWMSLEHPYLICKYIKEPGHECKKCGKIFKTINEYYTHIEIECD